MYSWQDFANNYSNVFLAMTLFSILSAVLMITIGTRLLARLPSDYFVNQKSRRTKNHLKQLPKFIQMLLPIAKNIIGILLIIAGLIMLITPGQGLLSILAGLILTNFPGKYAFERWLISRHRVYQTVNWLRERGGQPPFQLDQQGHQSRNKP